MAPLRSLLAVVWAGFVVGGLAAGCVGLRTLAELPRPASSTAATPTVPVPSVPTPAPLAVHPPLRDFDAHPPPFAPAVQVTPATENSPQGRLTILLLGIDQRPDEAATGSDPGRTDAMLLVSLDFDAHTAVLASVPRDGFVTIPDHGPERVNAAYPFGERDQPGSGPALATRTIAQLFGVPVDRYALVDIHSLERVIDLLGGVWIDNPARLVDSQYPTDDYSTITVDIPAGRQLMDGVTAVEYARTRHPDSDYGRQARQQQVLLALRDRAVQLDVLPRLPTLLPELLHLVRTDLSPTEIASLATFIRTLDRQRDIVAFEPQPDLTPSYTGPAGAAYIQLTPAYRAAVRRLVSEPRLAAERAQITVLNAGAATGAARRVAALIQNTGLLVSDVEQADVRAPTTAIEAGSAARLTAVAVAQVLDVPATALAISDDASAAVRVLIGGDFRFPSQ